MQDDDFSLFKNELRGVKPIKHDRADTGKPKADRAQLAKLRQHAIVRSNETIIDGLSVVRALAIAASIAAGSCPSTA